MPDDIAHIITFLCDDETAGFITGQTIVVDGGSMLVHPWYNNPSIEHLMKQ